MLKLSPSSDCCDGDCQSCDDVDGVTVTLTMGDSGTQTFNIARPESRPCVWMATIDVEYLTGEVDCCGTFYSKSRMIGNYPVAVGCYGYNPPGEIVGDRCGEWVINTQYTLNRWGYSAKYRARKKLAVYISLASPTAVVTITQTITLSLKTNSLSVLSSYGRYHDEQKYLVVKNTDVPSPGAGVGSYFGLFFSPFEYYYQEQEFGIGTDALEEIPEVPDPDNYPICACVNIGTGQPYSNNLKFRVWHYPNLSGIADPGCPVAADPQAEVADNAAFGSLQYSKSITKVFDENCEIVDGPFDTREDGTWPYNLMYEDTAKCGTRRTDRRTYQGSSVPGGSPYDDREDCTVCSIDETIGSNYDKVIDFTAEFY